jgi:hypothetical protein
MHVTRKYYNLEFEGCSTDIVLAVLISALSMDGEQFIGSTLLDNESLSL